MRINSMLYHEYRIFRIARAVNPELLRSRIKELSRHGYEKLGEVIFLSAEILGSKQNQYAQIMTKEEYD